MPERVGLVGRGPQPLCPAAAADPLAQVAAPVERAEVMTFQVGAGQREFADRRRRVDHGEPVVGGEDRHRAPRPLVDLAARDRDPGPVGIAGERPHRLLAVPAGADRVGHQRPLPVRPDHQPRGLRHGRAAAGAAPYPGDPVAGGRQLRYPEVLADLRPGRARGIDQDSVEQGPPRAVQGIDAFAGGESPVHDQAAAGVETHPAGRRRARRRQLPEQAPPVQQRRARHLQLMGADRVAGKRDPVHRQHPQPLPGQQHRGGGPGHPGSHHDHVVPARTHRRLLPSSFHTQPYGSLHTVAYGHGGAEGKRPAAAQP
jgi:hypothetical protein